MQVEACNLFLLPNLAEVKRTSLGVLEDMLTASASIDDLLWRVRYPRVSRGSVLPGPGIVVRRGRGCFGFGTSRFAYCMYILTAQCMMVSLKYKF